MSHFVRSGNRPELTQQSERGGPVSAVCDNYSDNNASKFNLISVSINSDNNRYREPGGEG